MPKKYRIPQKGEVSTYQGQVSELSEQLRTPSESNIKWTNWIELCC